LKKEFGHGLNELRRGLAKRGVVMGRDVARHFVFVATWDPEDRYDPGPGKPDEAERFIDAVEEVVKWAENRM
jgi:hypothetical protein